MKRRLSLKANLMIKPSNLVSKHYLWSLAWGSEPAEMTTFILCPGSPLGTEWGAPITQKGLELNHTSFFFFFPQDTVEVVKASDWVTGLIRLGENPREDPEQAGRTSYICSLGWKSLGIPQVGLEDVDIRGIPGLPCRDSCHLDPETDEWWRTKGCQLYLSLGPPVTQSI